MNQTLGLACMLTLQCMACYGQTNGCTASSVPFFIPQARLRAEAAAEPRLKTEMVIVSRPPPATPAANVGLDLNDGGFHSRVVREGEFYLTRSEPLPDSGVARFVHEIFTPEVIHLGKVSACCPFVTAIKKKNPLCILSGLSTMEGDVSIDFKLLELSW